MENDEKDVDLYDELDKALAADKSESEEKDSGASPEKPAPEVEPGKEKKPLDKEPDELSEEEISKLSPRAQKRIRDLADKVKDLAQKPEEKPAEKPADKKEEPEEKDKKQEDFKNVEEFLAAVEDEPSRELLRKFYNVVKGETSTILAPIEQKNNETRFENEFSQYAEKIEGLEDHKDDLKKTFMRNPGQSLKALVSELALDLQLNKVKPLEKTPSEVNRGGKINLDDLTTDQLYDLLEKDKP